MELEAGYQSPLSPLLPPRHALDLLEQQYGIWEYCNAVVTAEQSQVVAFKPVSTN